MNGVGIDAAKWTRQPFFVIIIIVVAVFFLFWHFIFAVVFIINFSIALILSSFLDLMHRTFRIIGTITHKCVCASFRDKFLILIYSIYVHFHCERVTDIQMDFIILLGMQTFYFMAFRWMPSIWSTYSFTQSMVFPPLLRLHSSFEYAAQFSMHLGIEKFIINSGLVIIIHIRKSLYHISCLWVCVWVCCVCTSWLQQTLTSAKCAHNMKKNAHFTMNGTWTNARIIDATH